MPALQQRLVCAIESTRRNPTRRSVLQASIHFFKIDKAQRHPHWTFDVRRSMLDVQPVKWPEQVKFHTSTASGRKRPV
jgi:hypothetical protein